MRYFIALMILVSASSFADVRSEKSLNREFACLNDHKQLAEEKMNGWIKDVVVNYFDKIGIAIADGSFSEDASLYPLNPGAAFFIGNLGYTSVEAANGVNKFDLSFSAESGIQRQAVYSVLYTSKGFDKVGNAVDAHCRLKFVRPYKDDAGTLYIKNAKTGYILTTISLPKSIVLY